MKLQLYIVLENIAGQRVRGAAPCFDDQAA